MDRDHLLTTEEVASLLSLSKQAVYELRRAGLLHDYALGAGKRAIRYRYGDVVDYRDSCLRRPRVADEAKVKQRDRVADLLGITFFRDYLPESLLGLGAGRAGRNKKAASPASG